MTRESARSTRAGAASRSSSVGRAPRWYRGGRRFDPDPRPQARWGFKSLSADARKKYRRCPSGVAEARRACTSPAAVRPRPWAPDDADVAEWLGAAFVMRRSEFNSRHRLQVAVAQQKSGGLWIRLCGCDSRRSPKFMTHGEVAQPVEQRTENPCMAVQLRPTPPAEVAE